MEDKKRKIVIVGGAGSVGSALAKRLAEENFDVVDSRPCDKVFNAHSDDYIDMNKLLREFINKKSHVNVEHCTGRKSDRKRNKANRWR